METFPSGSSGLNRDAVMRYVGEFYAFDAELSYRRAEVFGKVIASLTPEQKAAFAKMKFGDFNTWPDLDERDALKRPNPTTSRFFTVAYMTYASEFFSWYGGSVEADTYFCPERHGTYFGSFYMKDMPAMNKRNYDISTSVTGDSGESFLNLLTCRSARQHHVHSRPAEEAARRNRGSAPSHVGRVAQVPDRRPGGQGESAGPWTPLWRTGRRNVLDVRHGLCQGGPDANAGTARRLREAAQP